MPVGVRTLEGELDFIENVLVLRSSEGEIERRTLGGPVADFCDDVMRALARLGIEVTLPVIPSEVPDPSRLPWIAPTTRMTRHRRVASDRCSR